MTDYCKFEVVPCSDTLEVDGKPSDSFIVTLNRRRKVAVLVHPRAAKSTIRSENSDKPVLSG